MTVPMRAATAAMNATMMRFAPELDEGDVLGGTAPGKPPDERDRQEEYNAADRAASTALHEIEIRVSDLPYRVRDFTADAVEVLHERHRVGRGEDEVVRITAWATNRALMEALRTSRWRWWFFCRWRKAPVPTRLRGMVDYLPNLWELDELAHRQTLKEWEREQAEKRAAAQAPAVDRPRAPANWS